jgi:hypothetical protein
MNKYDIVFVDIDDTLNPSTVTEGGLESRSQNWIPGMK